MVNYKEILRLSHTGYSQRQIESSVHCSRHTVRDTLAAAERSGIAWPLEDSVSNEQIELILFPERHSAVSAYLEPDYAYIHRELAKHGVTLTLLWNEYVQKAESLDKKPYMTTQFGDKYRSWARITKATMRIQHKPGQAMQVDWAGDTLPIYDSVTGEVTAAYLFVAVLPCSCYTYAEITADEKLETWLNCHVHAYEYFGGVTRLLIPDNLKTGITKNTRYETVMNRSYHELAEYYNTAIYPTRVEHPQDKSHVEGSVKFASTWILAALRNERFFTLNEAKEAVRIKLEELNLKKFSEREGCRRTAYLEEEKAFMKPLPAGRYELAVWNPNIKVSTDYLVSDGRNKYSVPFDLIGERVDIRLTSNTVEVFFHGNRVASHLRRAAAQRDPIVDENHMTPEHRKYLNYNRDDFTAWAKSVGECTEKTVTYFLTSGKEPEQGYKYCASLNKLCERYGKAKLEAACAEVLKHTTVPSLRLISTILKNGLFKPEEKKSEVKENRNAYGITRGAAYYSSRRKDGESK